MKAKIALAMIAAAIAASTVTTPAAISDPVKTDAGLIAGETLPSGVRVFKGIPFGAPPVGNLRWREPQPVQKWEGVRDAKQFANVCVQPNQLNRQPVNVTVDLPDSPKMNEDCLYLNVWTQANRANERRPVMLWIFGGAYSEGGGSTPHNNGENLAKKGVVLVTFNYRLGIFGFYAHPELTKETGRNASGNQALADAIATLRWIKTNIAAFGGDPNNVTIFGESAGAAIVGMLSGSPVANRLFQRAIAESGGWMGLTMGLMRPRVQAEAAAGPRAGGAGRGGGRGQGRGDAPGGAAPGGGAPPAAGAAAAAPQAPPAAPAAPATPPPLPSLAELRARPTEEIRTMGLGGGQPIIDGWIIPEDLSITFANGKQNPVDVIAGYNKDEHTGFGGANNTNTAQRDGIAWHARIFAEKQTQLGKKAYFYAFTHEPPVEPPAPNLRATHAAEMVYVFNNLHAPRMIPDRSSPKLAMESEKDRALADQMSSYWVNFAKNGDPNGKGLPKWERFKDRNAPPHFLGEIKDWPGAEVLNKLDEAYKQKVLTPLGIKN